MIEQTKLAIYNKTFYEWKWIHDVIIKKFQLGSIDNHYRFSCVVDYNKERIIQLSDRYKYLYCESKQCCNCMVIEKKDKLLTANAWWKMIYEIIEDDKKHIQLKVKNGYKNVSIDDCLYVINHVIIEVIHERTSYMVNLHDYIKRNYFLIETALEVSSDEKLLSCGWQEDRYDYYMGLYYYKKQLNIDEVSEFAVILNVEKRGRDRERAISKGIVKDEDMCTYIPKAKFCELIKSNDELKEIIRYVCMFNSFNKKML